MRRFSYKQPDINAINNMNSVLTPIREKAYV